MRPIRISYDPEGDTLYITFGQPASAAGYQLSDQILVRINPETQEVAGLTIFNFSVHAGAGQDILLPRLEEDVAVKTRLMPALVLPPISNFLRITADQRGVRAVLLSPSLREAVAV